MKELFGLNQKDIAFLCNNKQNSIQKMTQSLEELYKKDNKLTDYDVLDIMSGGRGTEAYRRLTNFRIHSMEYMNSFDYLFNQKKFSLNTPQGMSLHVFRNKNQYGKAPKDLKTMNKFTALGYFICEGFSPCHNLTKETNTEEGRNASVSHMIYLVKNDLISKRNKFAKLGNISFRGRPNTSFEGCQFIYHAGTGKLVCDNINRGTWDYGQHGTLSHFLLDVSPWLDIGNGENIETPEMFYMSSDEENLYLKFTKEDVLKTAGVNVIPEKTAIQNLMQFISDMKNKKYQVQVKKNMKSKEDLEDKQLNALDEYVNTNICLLESSYAIDWQNYVSLCTMIDNKDLIKDLGLFVKTMESNPEALVATQVNDKFKLDYMKWLFTSTIGCIKQEDLEEGKEITNDLQITLKIFINPMVKNNLLKLNNLESIEEFRKMRDKTIEEIDQRLNKINFTCRVMDDVTSEHRFEHFMLTITQKRVLSKNEVILAKKSSIQSRLDPNLQNTERNFEKELTKPTIPEYNYINSSENVPMYIAVGGVAVLTGIGLIEYFYKLITGRTDYFFNIKDDELKAKIESKADKFIKIIEMDYNLLKGIDEKIRSSKILNDLYNVDKYGNYYFSERNTKHYRDSVHILNYNSFNEKVMQIIQTIIEKNKKNKYGILNDVKRMKYNFSIIEGEPIIKILEKVYTENKDLNSKHDKVYLDNTKVNEDISVTKRLIERVLDSHSDQVKGYELVPIYDKEIVPNGIKHYLVANIQMKNHLYCQELIDILNSIL